jgi:hyperosmotically inducible protein
MKTIHIRRQNSMLAITCLSAVLVLTACQEKGPAEKAGEKIDQVTEKAGQKIDQATANVSKELESSKSAVSAKADTAGEYIDDSIITSKVKEAILADDLLKVSQIEVTTVNGVVKLNGSLASEQLVAKAVELAVSQKNVKSVQNELHVGVDAASK